MSWSSKFIILKVEFECFAISFQMSPNFSVKCWYRAHESLFLEIWTGQSTHEPADSFTIVGDKAQWWNFSEVFTVFFPSWTEHHSYLKLVKSGRCHKLEQRKMMLVCPGETQDSMNVFSCFISFLSAYLGSTSKPVCLSTQNPSLWPSESIHIFTVRSTSCLILSPTVTHTVIWSCH